MKYRIVFVDGAEIITEIDIMDKVLLAEVNGLYFIKVDDRLINTKNIVFIEEYSG